MVGKSDGREVAKGKGGIWYHKCTIELITENGLGFMTENESKEAKGKNSKWHEKKEQNRTEQNPVYSLQRQVRDRSPSQKTAVPEVDCTSNPKVSHTDQTLRTMSGKKYVPWMTISFTADRTNLICVVSVAPVQIPTR